MNYQGIITYAMEMEMYGHKFFKEQGNRFENPTTKSLFLKLSEIELQHYEFLKQQLQAFEKDGKFDVNKEILDFDDKDLIFESRRESEHIEATLEQSDVPDLTILRMAYLIEKDFKEFYTEAARHMEEEDIKKLFEKLASWEAGHEALFKNEYDKKMQEYLSVPWGG